MSEDPQEPNPSMDINNISKNEVMWASFIF